MEHLESQHADVVDSLKKLQEDRHFFDFTLHLQEGPLSFPRLLLASMSPFFHKLVTVDMEESKSSHFLMEEVTQDTWTCVTSFYFSSRKLVSIHNVQDVLEASHRYGLEKLVQYCSEFLESHCSAENCLEFLKLATRFGLENLSRRAKRVLVDNFSSLCKGEDFLNLEKADLLELLEEEEVVITEDDLCQALLAWMEKNEADADTCIEVFQHLRLSLISDERVVSQVLYHSVCMRCPSIQSLVKQEMARRMQSTSNRQTQVQPWKRRLRSAKNSLFVLGVNCRKMFVVYVWSFDERRWTRVPGPPFTAEGAFSCTALEDTVIVTGGEGARSTHLFDLETQKWSIGPDLLEERYAPGLTTIGDTAYVVGGIGDVGTLSSIEEYSKGSRRWIPTGRLLEATVGRGVASLGETILAVGGTPHGPAQLIHTFNVRTRSASVLDFPLPCGMDRVTAVSIGTSAFFAGEGGDLVQVSQVEGTLQMTSYAVLEEFTKDNLWFGLHASGDCVRVVGKFMSRSVCCWDLTGRAVANDEVEDLPEEIVESFALEVDVPAWWHFLSLHASSSSVP